MIRVLLVVLGLALATAYAAYGQPTPRGVFLRSLVVPGWGHHHADPGNWTRGQVHLAADIALIGAYFGYDRRADRLRTNLVTHARQYAGIDLAGRGRALTLAVANHSDLAAHNDFMDRSRNWDRLIEDVPQNRWQWSSEDRRNAFVRLDNDRQAAKDQLPALASLMVANRIFAAIGAIRGLERTRLTAGMDVDTGTPLLQARITF